MHYTPEAWDHYQQIYKDIEMRDMVLAEELANNVIRLDESLDSNPMLGRYYATCDGLSLYAAMCCEGVAVLYSRHDVRVAVGFVTGAEIDRLFD
jgi:hypothetical protein